MKKILALSAAAVMALTAGVFAEDTQQTGDSSAEVVVKGQLKIKIESAKPEMSITTDSMEVAKTVVKTEEEFMSLSPEDIMDVKLGLPEKIAEERPEYRADLFSLETLPVFNLQAKMPAGVEIDRWNFKVTDPTGATVRNEKGNGNIPSRLVWDGFDQNGQVLKLNAPYTYILSYMDKAGNPGSAKAKAPKIVQSVKYYRDGKLYIEASGNVLFDKDRKDRFTDKGKLYLEEIEDYIKMSNRFPIDVIFYAEDAGLAKDQADSLKAIFDKTLKLPKNSYNFKGVKDNSVPKNYRVVFVING